MARENKNYGKIKVYTVLDSEDGEKLKGIKINLYRINGVSPSLEESKFTDENGYVEFTAIPEGNYRIIEIIDKKKFLKPSYRKWNEVNISKTLRETEIFIINKIR